MRSVQEKVSELKNLLIEILETEPDGYGRILRALSEVSKDPTIDELAVRAYRNEEQDMQREQLVRAEPDGLAH